MTEQLRTRQRRRFVDAHVHLWDAANGWYQFPTPEESFGLGLGDAAHFPSRFLLDDYRSALGSVDVAKIVHVNATATAADAVEETRWLATLANKAGVPNAIIGTLDTAKSLVELEADLDEQMSTPLYRGIRLLHGLDYEKDHGRGLLQMLSDRKLIYDAVAHPGGGIAAAARAAARHPELVMVMEHTGWPLQTDQKHFEIWKSEISEFAAVPGTICKLSGLGMTHHRTDVNTFRQYWDHSIDIFGANRCMFASNFPVDRFYGSFDDLLQVFESTAASLQVSDAELLFGATAERVYRI